MWDEQTIDDRLSELADKLAENIAPGNAKARVQCLSALVDAHRIGVWAQRDAVTTAFGRMLPRAEMPTFSDQLFSSTGALFSDDVLQVAGFVYNRYFDGSYTTYEAFYPPKARALHQQIDARWNAAIVKLTEWLHQWDLARVREDRMYRAQLLKDHQVEGDDFLNAVTYGTLFNTTSHDLTVNSITEFLQTRMRQGKLRKKVLAYIIKTLEANS